MSRRILPLLALLSAASALPAQAPPTLAMGAHIRVTLPSDADGPPRRVSGTLERLVNDTVVVRRGNLPSQTIALGGGAVLELDTSKGHGGAGLLVGAALGGLLSAQPCGNCGGKTSPVLVVAGAAAGGILGALVGSLMRSASWVRMPTAGIRIGATP